MEELKFYNVKTKKSFTTDDYKLVKKEYKTGTRYFAIAFQDGIEVWRIISKLVYEDNK